VLGAYGYQCAVCGFDLRISDLTVGLEAAHIQWHQAHGPSEVTNGLALCAVHHKLFDFGAFVVEASGELLVSEHVSGGALEPALLRFHQRPIARPVRVEHAPAPQYLTWHRSEVFKEAPRD
jgi:putative restriction endonuclease